MESFAVLRAARRFGVPMVGLRGISDGRSDLTGLNDWSDYLHLVDERLGAVIDGFANDAKTGRFELSGD